MMWKNLVLLLVVFSSTTGHLLSQQAKHPVFIIDSSFDKNGGKIKLDDKVSYFIEQGEEVAVETMLEAGAVPGFKTGFSTLPADSLSGNFWVAFTLLNATDDKRSLRFHFVADRLSLYISGSNNKLTRERGGFILPYGQWPAMNTVPKVNDPNGYPFEMDAHSALTILARSEPMGLTSNEFKGIFLYSEKTYLQEVGAQFTTISNLQLIVQGMFLIMLLFNLFMFAINKDRAYLFYSLYVCCIAYYLLAANGFERLFLWGSHAPFSLPVFNMSVYGIGIFYSLFAIHFLHRGGWKPKLRKWMRYFIYFSLASMLITTIYLFMQAEINRAVFDFMNFSNMPSSLLGIVLFLYVNIAYLRSRNKTARYFALAGLSLITGLVPVTIVNLLRVTNILPDTSSSQVSNITMIIIYQASCLVQILLFALALSYRSRLIEKEKTELEVMDTTKARFFANISHEFKTPLTLILGPAAELGKRTNDTYFKNTLGIIEKNARRLLGLITEILDLSKLDAGKMKLQLQKKDIIDFIQKQTLLFSSQADSKNIQLAFSSSVDSLAIAFDPDKIEKALTNLLSNACKFTPAGGKVSVRANRISKLNGQFISIEVKDTGVGISPDHLPHLFERFYHANQKNYVTDQPSTGIGLALTEELVKMHRGTIEVTSKINQGTVVTVLLPVDLVLSADQYFVDEADPHLSAEMANTRLLAPGLPEKEQVDSELPQVLVIEDNEDLRAYIGSCLESYYTIIEAGDGEQGTEQAIKNIPDLVITDVMMPKKDGFEVTRDLKQNEKTSHIPVIILTGKSSQASRLEGLQTEADVYLSKPFDADELRLQISNLLRNRQRMQERYSKKLFLETSHQEVTSVEEEFLQKALRAVEENLSDENFSVDQLSKALFMDRTQLFRKLKALTDQNPSNFIRNLRLKKAKYMLENGAGTVADIAFAVGFGSTTYFNKCFKEFYGESPGRTKA
ncbi:MAG: response regulator [Chitinophagaceae bacterium]|nr:response regulator [Chitinophagaceae bacterium]